MTYFATPQDELLETQRATEQLLAELALSELEATDHSVARLDRLASSCAKLAYGNNLNSMLTSNVHNLITWCDHLDQPSWRSNFLQALKANPLVSPL
jgi:hypothetical protein